MANNRTVLASDVLESAAAEMANRATMYDRPAGERSMAAAVCAFASITGITLTEEQGWLLMVLLKAVRSQQGDYRPDNYVDGTAYFSLAGEAAACERGARAIAA